MNININGENTETKAESLLNLLLELELNPQATVVEKNGIVISMADYNKEPLQENDILELIRFVGGG